VRFGSRRSSPSTRTVACKAPFTSMYLDQHGFVRACCMNKLHVLGNVGERLLSAIWHGEEADQLRRAMERHDLDLGCDFCKWPVEDGRPDLAFSRWFEEFDVAEADPAWPRQLEFSVSNTCNLQCIQCNGEWSSSIRSQREGLPPLAKVYGEAFFEDLRAFLPHLERAKFLGGEPFLAGETLRIMELMVEEGATARAHVTTNGTQWSPRVERILDLLPIDIALSLDAATAATYESIRVGSSWATVQENLDRFQAHAARTGAHVSVTYCLMTRNWHEFADFCLMADARGLSCDVNTVTQPDHLSLYHLPVGELEQVVAGLEEADRRHGDAFDWSRATWTAELDRLRRHLADRRRGAAVVGVDVHDESSVLIRPFDPDRTAAPVDTPPAPAAVEPWADDLAGLDTAELHFDVDGVITSTAAAEAVLGLDAALLVGRRGDDLLGVLGEHLAPLTSVETEQQIGDQRALRLEVAGRGALLVRTVAVHDDRHRRAGSTAYLAWAPPA
jgi:MoaA/NifB/PqqE/SkfB family radical SAM enzyme